MNTIPNATCNPCIPSYPSQGFLLFLLRPFIPPPRRLVACFLIPLHLIWYTFIHACDKASSIRKYCVRMRASQSREIGRWTILLSGRICMGSRFKNANFSNLCHGNCGVERRKADSYYTVCNLTSFQEFMPGGRGRIVNHREWHGQIGAWPIVQLFNRGVWYFHDRYFLRNVAQYSFIFFCIF